MSNLPLSQQCADALEDSARAESEAIRLEKLAKRVFSQLVINSEGSVNIREHLARAHLKYTEAEDAYITAQTAANLARAKSDGLRLRFEAWRTEESSERARMNLR